MSGSTLAMIRAMAPSAFRYHAHVVFVEADGRYIFVGNGACICHDIFPSDLVSLVDVSHNGDLGVADVAVDLKVCHPDTHGCHRTPLEVACFSGPNGLAHNLILLYCEEEADKV